MTELSRRLRTAPAASLYLRAAGRIDGSSAGQAVATALAAPLFGGPAAFTLYEILRREETGFSRHPVLVTEFPFLLGMLPTPHAERLRGFADNLTQPLPAWAGFDLAQPLIMGIVNVTPDSFSDGGDHLNPDTAIAHGIGVAAAGAAIVDVGGESTRPGARPVPTEIEVARIVPVVRGLAERGLTVSIDTRHADVMAAALSAGARIVNDVSALADPAAAALVARHRAPVSLMHMQGEPQSMQHQPYYRSAPLDVFDVLKARISAAMAAGIARDNILIDPGIGFGKTDVHNLEILEMLGLLRASGQGVLLGVSRKGFIGRISGTNAPAKDRLAGSLALALDGLAQGANILRVHDVAETAQAVRVLRAGRW